MTKFWAAWQFLTIFPGLKYRPEELSRSAGYFPLIGLILGLILAGLDWGLRLILPGIVVNILLVSALLFMTRAIHFEGLLDTFDGLGKPGESQERLRAMSDSRIGALGVTGGCLLLLLRYACLFHLTGNSRVLGLILMPVIGRWALTYAIFSFPAAKREGMGWLFKQGTGRKEFALSSFLTLAVSLALLGLRGLILLLSALLVSTVASIYFRKVFGGHTGDTYGALSELTEVSFLLIFPFAIRPSALIPCFF